jgi:P4 family phage/plasmid primase-like protien
MIYKDNTIEMDYRQFLSKYHAKKGSEYTHTSIGNPRTSLYVSDEDYQEFMECYKSYLLKKDIQPHLTEKPKNPSCIRIDFDFNFPLTEDIDRNNLPRLHTKNHIKNILNHFYKLLNTYVDIKNENDTITYVLEKPKPYESKNRIKDGIHIIMPKIIVPNEFQHFMRTKLLGEVTLFEGIPCSNLPEQIYDAAVIDKNNWQMYGSCKPNNDTYVVTQVYKYSNNTLCNVKLPKSNDELNLVEELSMRKKTEQTNYNSEKVTEIEEYIRVILPTILNNKKDKLHQQIFGDINLTKTQINTDTLQFVKGLVSCLSKTRSEDYDSWIKLGWTLRNIDSRLLQEWINFSEVSDKYVSGECEKLWDRMKIDTLGIGSLHYWAKQDNPELYNKLLDDNVIGLIDRCIESKGAHYDVSRVVHMMYKYQYKFITKDLWYIYSEEKHRWLRAREALKLRTILSTSLCQKFMERATYWNQEKTKKLDDDIWVENCEKKRAISLDIITKLKSAGYKDSIMKECKAHFCDEKFEETLDSRPHLIGFNNGVYDLCLHEFREGNPDDYISFSTGRNYIPYNPDSENVLEINTFLSQVFTIPDIKRYIVNIFSSMLDGGILQEKFYIFTGNGSNSKSKLLELIQKAVGDYYCILPISLLTQKRAASNSAQSELERTKGRRFAVMQEPSENEKINIGLMKELSGGDRIMTRGLFKEPIEFKPQFKMIMTCNELPEVPSDDGGTWRRIRVVDFSSKFTDNPDPNNPREFKIDTELANKFERWADTFISMLIHNHKSNNLNNIPEPTEVRIATEGYKKNNDIIGQFVNETLYLNEESDTRIKLQKLYQDFKGWASSNVSKSKKVPDRNQVRAYLEKTFGAYDEKKGWNNIGIIMEGDNSEDED